MHELKRFHGVGDEVLLTPHPFGKARRPARLIERDAAAKKAVYEDAENDSTRRFICERTASDTSTLTLQGQLRGAPAEQVITFKPKPRS